MISNLDLYRPVYPLNLCYVIKDVSQPIKQVVWQLNLPSPAFTANTWVTQCVLPLDFMEQSQRFITKMKYYEDINVPLCTPKLAFNLCTV